LVGFDAIGTALHPSFARRWKPQWSAKSLSKRWTIFPVKCRICVSR
jgi:hypothetical protein